MVVSGWVFLSRLVIVREGSFSIPVITSGAARRAYEGGILSPTWMAVPPVPHCCTKIQGQCTNYHMLWWDTCVQITGDTAPGHSPGDCHLEKTSWRLEVPPWVCQGQVYGFMPVFEFSLKEVATLRGVVTTGDFLEGNLRGDISKGFFLKSHRRG